LTHPRRILITIRQITKNLPSRITIFFNTLRNYKPKASVKMT